MNPIEFANERRGSSFGSIVRGLKRFKKSDHDKLQLLQQIKDADRLERAALRPMENRKVLQPYGGVQRDCCRAV